MKRLPVAAWRSIMLALLLVLWQLLSLLLGKLLLPSPLSVFEAAGPLLASGQLLSATGQSLLVFGIGYLLAILVAIPLGVLMGGYRRLGATLEIYVNAMNSTPRVAFVPLVGLAVFPLQLAALLLRGLVFEYIGLTAMGAYVTLYDRHMATEAASAARQASIGDEAGRHPAH